MRFAKALPAIAAGVLLGTWLPFVVHEYGHAIGAWYTGVEVHYIQTSPWNAHISTDGANLATLLGGVVSTTVGAVLFLLVQRDGLFWASFGWFFLPMSAYLSLFFMPIGTASDGDVISMMIDPHLAWGIGAVSLLLVLCSTGLFLKRVIPQ